MNERKRYESLDGLRGVFAMVILLYHTLPETPLFSAIPMTSFLWKYGGDFANTVFFILSGFLMANTYCQRISGRQTEFGAYLLGRLKRLYPMYLLTNAVCLVMGLLWYGPSAINLKRIILTILLQAGGGLEATMPYNGLTWFLSALTSCYIVYYAVAYWGNEKNTYRILLAIVIAWGYGLMGREWDFPFCSSNTGNALLNFFVGCAMAEIYPNIGEKTRKYLCGGGYCILAGSFALMMTCGVETICGNCGIAFSMVLCPIVVYLALCDKWMRKILNWKLFQHIGKMSMMIYFWHMATLSIFCYLIPTVGETWEINEWQFVMYFAFTMIWCELCQWWTKRK